MAVLENHTRSNALERSEVIGGTLRCMQQGMKGPAAPELPSQNRRATLFLYIGDNISIMILKYNFRSIQKFMYSKVYTSQVCWQEKAPLPWITRSAKRELRKRDRLYQKSQRSKDPRDRRAFLNSKHGVRHKLKVAYS